MQIALILFILGLATLFGYFGFIRPDPMPSVNTRNRFTSVVLTILAGVLAFALHSDRRVPDDLGEIIRPYPGATGTRVPRTEESYNVYLLETEDPPESVLEFYRDEENRSGWSVKLERPRSVTLERDGLTLLILPIQVAGKTTISYMVAPRKE